MRIDLDDKRVAQALHEVKVSHPGLSPKELEKVFKEQYHCEIVADPSDPWCTTGWLDISEDKYRTWFILKFGADRL